jgi:hypothetical protein
MEVMRLRARGGRATFGTAGCAALFLAGCTTPDPAAIVKVSEVETHWAVDNSEVGTQYIAPVVRFKLANISPEPQGSIEVTATFRRKGEDATWGGDFRQVSTRRKPLMPGQSEALVLKSDTRYYSNGPTEGMFTHKDFKDTTVEVFVRVGRSRWTKFTDRLDVERHIGARSVQDVLPSPAPSPAGAASPSPSPAGRR